MGQRIGTAVGTSAQRQPLTFTLVFLGLLLAHQMPAVEEAGSQPVKEAHETW